MHLTWSALCCLRVVVGIDLGSLEKELASTPASEWPLNSLQTLLDLRRKDGGVILWSLGRCATASLADTLVKNSGGLLRYCRGRKESFSSRGVTASGLEECAGQVAHVKPQHISRRSSTVASPREFVHAAHPHFHILVVVRRQNHLARLVSSFENRLLERRLSVEQGADVASRFFETPLRTIRWESDMLEEGAEAAKKLFRVVFEFDFETLTSNLCQAVSQLLAALPRQQQQHLTSCAPHISHVRVTPRRFGKLEDRVGKQAAKHIRNDLQGTTYEWMLDLNASRWPHPRPLPRTPDPGGPRPNNATSLRKRTRRKHKLTTVI